MQGLLGSAVPVLESAMRFRVARQSALAANLANVDTPGYRRVDMTFDMALDRASTRLSRTHPAHSAGISAHGYRLEIGEPSPRPDRNGVELEREVIALSRNAGAFTQQSAAMAQLMAITRVAVIGDAR